MHLLSIGPVFKEITRLLEYKKEKPLIDPIDGKKPRAPQDITHPFGPEEEAKEQRDTNTGSQIQTLRENHGAKHNTGVARIIEKQFTEVMPA
jgi:hypothetical protein